MSDAAFAAGAGDPVVNVNNAALVKLNAADGSVQWVVPARNDGTLAIDPTDLSVYTAGITHSGSNTGTIYKFAADGTPNQAGSVGASSYTTSNNPDVAKWNVDLSDYVSSVDVIVVQPGKGGYVYAASAADSKIVVVDPATNNVVTSFETAISPRHIAISPEGGNVYIADGENPFVIAYTPTGALLWVNLNVGGTVSNIATAKATVGTGAVASCGVPTFRIGSDRNSIHKGESATINIGYGSGSLPPCNNNITAYFVVKTKAQNNVDFTFTDANGQDATQVGVLFTGPLTLTHLYSSRKKTLPVNITLKKDPAYYSGNTKVTVQLLAK